MTGRAMAAALMASMLAACSNFAADQPTAMTAEEAFVVQRHVAACWKMPAGAEAAAPVSLAPVSLALEMNPDRTVRRAKIVPPTALGTAGQRAMAESALAAVRDPKCHPLPLPPEKQALWKTTVIQMDPKAR